MTRRFLLLSLLALTACGSDPVGLTPTQQVYEVVMNEILQDPLREVILIDEISAPSLIGEDVGSVSYHIQNAGDVPEALMESLIASAQEPRPIDWQPIMVNARFASPAEVSGSHDWGSLEFWRSFPSRFSGQSEFYALSDVAFNDDYSEAALVVSYYCPVMCGAGEFLVHLTKSDMQWTIVGSSAFWIT